MSSFTTRVELHSNSYPDFELLHTAMENRGFSRTITSDSNVLYHLPRAEYNIWTQKDASGVLALAEAAVATTGKTAEILVTESASRRWSGLSKVHP